MSEGVERGTSGEAERGTSGEAERGTSGEAERGTSEPSPDPGETQPAPLPETPWLRLDPRMLLVHPVREVGRFLPVLVGVVVLGASGDRIGWPQLLAVVVPVVIGLARYLTTRYRIHADRVELKRGLLSTHVLSTPLDRVRTVDITASPVQRLLSLATVRIGTGTGGDDDLDLDGLPVEQARALRARLLHSIRPAAPVADPEAAAVVAGEEVVARFETGWLRYAPFTSAGFVALAGVVGVGFQLFDELGLLGRFEGDPTATGLRLGGVAALLALAAGVAVLVAVFSVVGYAVANGNFALSHTHPDGSWHVRRGLLTTRETSLDDDRLRGVAVGEPWGLRVVRGGRLSAIVTGLDRTEQGSSVLLPPAPRTLVDRVAAAVVGSPDPVHTPLVGHGPRARARRWSRALVPTGLIAAALVALAVAVDLPGLAVLAALPLLAGAALAHDRARSLGHALVGGWLVARSGSLTRRRELLAADAVIGWNLRSTWFQRRAGLVTLVATTAGGRQYVAVPDVPEQVAVDLARAAVPGLVEQFTA